MRLSEADLIKLERQNAATNIDLFRTRVCKYDDFQPFHKEIDRVLDSKSRYKLIMLPRNHLKSSAMMSWILFNIRKTPDISILYESSVYLQAKKYLSEMRAHLESGEWTSLWGDWKGPLWTDSAITVNKRTIIQPAPTISASGLDKTQTGQHYDLIILDDIVDELNSRTTEGREKAINRYKQALSLLRPNGSIVLIGTPWDSEDLYAWALSNKKIREMFEILKLDIYTDQGKILFPQKFCETIDQEKASDGKLRSFESLRIQLGPFHFSCQYRLNPKAEQFSEFNTKWIRRVSEDDCEKRLQEKHGKIYIFCDPALGKDVKQDACDTGLVVGHFMEDHRIDMLRDYTARYTPGDAVEFMHAIATKYAVKKEVEVFIEDVLFQSLIIRDLEHRRTKGGVYYQITPCHPRENKDRRIRNMFVYYQNGQISHSNKMIGSKLEHQLERFGKEKHKDAVDAESQFVEMTSWPVRSFPDKDEAKYPHVVVEHRARIPKKSKDKGLIDGVGEKSYMGEHSYGDY